MENKLALNDQNQEFFITEDERKKLIENENRKTRLITEDLEENSNDDNYSPQNLESNEYITDTENLQSEENESESKINYEAQINKELICEFYQAIKDDNIPFLEEFTKTDANIKFLNYADFEGILPIHYAVLFGNIQTIKFLVDRGVEVNKDLEGIPILHLSLSFAENFQKLKKIQDRLGRNILHMIFQYDLHECFQIREETFSLDDFKVKELSMETPIDYIAVYNSHQSFKRICEMYHEEFILNLIFNYDNKFLEKILTYKSFELLEVIILFFIDRFEKFIEIKNELIKNNSSNVVDNNENIQLQIKKDHETLHNKLNLLLEALNKLQKHLSDKINQWAKAKERKILQTDGNIKYNIDNEIQMDIINTNYQDICNVVKKIDINFQNYFKMNEFKTSNFNEKLVPDLIHEHSIFDELKFNPLIFFEEIRQSIKALFNKFTVEIKNLHQKTLIVYHNKCFKHCDFSNFDLISRIKKRNHLVENPDRLNVLFQPPFGIFLSDFFLKNYEFVGQSKPGCLADIVKIHDYDYVMKIKNICESASTVGNTQIMKYDRDTSYSMDSFEAAIQAVGCVIEAIEKVVEKKAKNAFVAVRPPGHHAGYFGKVSSEIKHDNCCSNGFCFFNNIAVGASYAMHKYRNIIKKIAIVDIDVHHGNGTEDVVKNLQKNYYDLTASTGLDNLEGGISLTVKQSICKPWLDFDDNENVLFVSMHGYNTEHPEMFYPSSGSGQTNTLRGRKPYPAGILNIPINGESKYSPEYKQIFMNRVIPRLHKFKPDLILVSAGFDGHELEEMNLDYMKLNENDYRFITEELSKIANKYSEGRIVSVLEGGYNINSGIVSSFAQSVMTHAKFLNIGVNKFYFDVNNNSNEIGEIGENVKLSSLEQARLKAKRKREFYMDQINYRTLKKMKVEIKNEEELCKVVSERNENSNNITTSFYNNLNENGIQINNVPKDLIKKKNVNNNHNKVNNHEDLGNIHSNFFNNNAALSMDSEPNVYNLNSIDAAAYNQTNLNLIDNVNSQNFLNLNLANRKSHLDDEFFEGLNYNKVHEKNESHQLQTNNMSNQDIDQFINLNENLRKKEEIQTANQTNIQSVEIANNNNSNSQEEEILVEFEDE